MSFCLRLAVIFAFMPVYNFIEIFFRNSRKIKIALGGSGLLKLSQSARSILFFTAVCLVFAWFIVWQASYFVFFLAAALFIIAIFWKTEKVFFALLVYLPFQIALNPAENIDLASSRILIIALFFAWIIKSLAKKKLIVPYVAITWLLVFFLGLAVFSAYFSINQEKSAIRILFYLSIFPFYFIAADLLDSIIKISKAVYALLFSAAIAAVVGIIQFAGQFVFGIEALIDFWSKNIAILFYGQSFGKAVIANPSWLVNVGGETFFRAISFFPDPHMFAFYLGLVEPLALSLAFVPRIFNFSDLQKFFLYACNALLLLALGFTFSRAGYVGAFFGIGAMILSGWKFFDKRLRFSIITAVLIAGILIYNSSGLMIARFFSSFTLSEGSNSERLLNWRQAVKIIEDNPIVGVGVGAYSEALNARSPERSSVSAHNTYLDIAAEMGIPALLAWFVILLLVIKNLLNMLKINSELTREKVFSIGLVGAVVWFSIQMFFDTAIYSPVLLAVFMLYLAISVNLSRSGIIFK